MDDLQRMKKRIQDNFSEREAQEIQNLREFAYTRAFYTSSEAAKALGKSPNALERMRWNGSGPKFRRCGGIYLYRLSDLEVWVRKQRAWPGRRPNIKVVQERRCEEALDAAEIDPRLRTLH